MDVLDILSIITSGLTIIGIIFGAFLYFRNPQVKSEKKDALLEQRMQWEKESNEKRFADMGVRLDTATTIAQNHIHTVDVKVDGLISQVNTLTNEITRLSTTMEERLPKKQS